MEQVIASFPALIAEIEAVIKSKFLSNEYLNQWYDQQLEIINAQPLISTYFQDARYSKLNIDATLSEASKATDEVFIKISNAIETVYKTTAQIATSYMSDNPAFDSPQQLIDTFCKSIIEVIPIRNSAADVICKNATPIDTTFINVKTAAIKATSFTYTTAPDKVSSNIYLYISKDSGKYFEASEKLKQYLQMVIRTIQTTRSDLSAIATYLTCIANTYKQYKQYFNEQHSNNMY